MTEGAIIYAVIGTLEFTALLVVVLAVMYALSYAIANVTHWWRHR